VKGSQRGIHSVELELSPTCLIVAVFSFLPLTGIFVRLSLMLKLDTAQSGGRRTEVGCYLPELVRRRFSTQNPKIANLFAISETGKL
jgi:hypothetical protein